MRIYIDRGITLAKAAAVSVLVLAAAAAFIAVFGIIVESLHKV